VHESFEFCLSVFFTGKITAIFLKRIVFFLTRYGTANWSRIVDHCFMLVGLRTELYQFA
jgi:hypothetical protein